MASFALVITAAAFLGEPETARTPDSAGRTGPARPAASSKGER
jgi:hypothetical protein